MRRFDIFSDRLLFTRRKGKAYNGWCDEVLNLKFDEKKGRLLH